MSSAYIEQVIEDVKKRNPGEPEFIQTVEEVLRSLEPAMAQHPRTVQQCNRALQRRSAFPAKRKR